MQHPLPKAVYLFNLATVAPPLPTFPLPPSTHTHTHSTTIAGGMLVWHFFIALMQNEDCSCCCWWVFRQPTQTRTPKSAATIAATHSGTCRHTHTHKHTFNSAPIHSTLHFTPSLAALDKLSTHIIYTFKRATLRHVELATRLRLAFYEFISVHLRPMWRRQLTEAVIKLNCLLLLLLLLLWRVLQHKG